jgi:hypothetical protein
MPMVTLASGLALSCANQGDRSGPVVLLLPGPTDSWRSYEHLLALVWGTLPAGKTRGASAATW